MIRSLPQIGGSGGPFVRAVRGARNLPGNQRKARGQACGPISAAGRLRVAKTWRKDQQQRGHRARIGSRTPANKAGVTPLRAAVSSVEAGRLHRNTAIGGTGRAADSVEQNHPRQHQNLHYCCLCCVRLCSRWFASNSVSGLRIDVPKPQICEFCVGLLSQLTNSGKPLGQFIAGVG